MSLKNRRRAIYTGLASHLNEDELIPLLSFWEANYADKPTFALNEFLTEVVKRCGRKLERGNLYRELISVMNGPSSALLPDPEPKLEAWRKGAGAAAVEVNGPQAQARQTFVALSDCLFAMLPLAQGNTLRRFAASNLKDMGVDTELRLRLRGWLEQGGSLARINLELEQWRKLLSLIYIGLCEYLGPVQADCLLTSAVLQVEQLDLPLPPKKLL
ncbi:MAG: hypothetical protein ACI9EB_000859 [Pseudomonas sp.]|jgi:hypothetical protein